MSVAQNLPNMALLDFPNLCSGENACSLFFFWCLWRIFATECHCCSTELQLHPVFVRREVEAGGGREIDRQRE